MTSEGHSERTRAARKLFDSGELGAAEKLLQEILGENPLEKESHLLLGVICARTRRLSDASTHLETALRAEPKNYDGLTWLAVVKRQQYEIPLAIELYQSAINVKNDDPVVFNHLGSCWLALRNSKEAADAFAAAIRLEPRAAQGYFNLGMALSLDGSSPEAFHAFKRASELDPDYLPCYAQLLKQMQHLLNWKEGVEILEKGYRRHPQSISMLVALGVTYGKLGRREEAERMFLAAADANAIGGPPYAHWLHEEGRFEDASRVLARSIELDPTLGEAYHNLAVAKCFGVNGTTLVEAGLDALQRPDLRPNARMFLHYAIAKGYDDRMEFESAIHHYDEANAMAYGIYNADVRYDPEAAEQSLRDIKQLYSGDRVQQLRALGYANEQPILVVGMIRSGTTLLDQILSSHSSIRSAGEQPFWGQNTCKIEAKWAAAGGRFTDVALIASKYIEALENAAGKVDRVVDKMPVNYRYLGMISSVLPKARIIHLRRNPMDTCVSIYTTYLGDATYFAYDQRNIVGTYLDYLNLMAYWRTILPSDRFLEIDYEDLVSESEPTVRRIMEFCGVSWEDACLSHETSTHHVSTPSLFTSRQPINKNSIERWRRYEPWLRELLQLRDVSHPI